MFSINIILTVKHGGDGVKIMLWVYFGDTALEHSTSEETNLLTSHKTNGYKFETSTKALSNRTMNTNTLKLVI